MMGRGNKARVWSLVDGFLGRPTAPAGSIYQVLGDAEAAQFEDAAFGGMYAGRGRPSYPPSVMVKLLLLSFHEGTSDEESEQRCRYDLRWKYALGLHVSEDGPDKTTLSRFRSRLIANGQAGAAFGSILRRAREQGLLGAEIAEVVDSTAVLGAGAVQDTWTMIRKARRDLARQLAEVPELAGWAGGIVAEPDDKPEVDWKDEGARRQALNELVAQARTALEQVAATELNAQQQQARDLLQSVLGQDVETDADGQVRIRRGVAKDRICSVTDPEMRHGHKSSSGRFDGHKAEVGIDQQSELITHVQVIAGNGADGGDLASKLAETEQAVGVRISAVTGDTAYGRPEIRAAMAARNTQLRAPEPDPHNRGLFTKDAFAIDVQARQCVCPAQQRGRPTFDAKGRLNGFRFAAKTCAICPLRGQCTTSRHGRTLSIRADEEDYQARRAVQRTAEWRTAYRQRARIERTMAELARCGMRQARYLGRAKTELQLLFTATAINLLRLVRPHRGGSITACA